MFSRSDTPDDSFEEESPTQRSPLILAGLAGVLALAGAFLLVWYLRGDSADAVQTVADATEQQVLVVTQPIEAGTTISDILASPNAFLSARSVPEQFVAPAAITSIQELQDLGDLTLAYDALPGEQLLQGRFVDRGDFQNESFLDRVATVAPPEGHHQVVLALPASQALGGLVRAGDNVSVISAFRVSPPEGDPFEVSVVVLPTIEVVNVDTTSTVVGEVSVDADAVGLATVGDFAITVAVEPDELTDLTYAMKYGDIILAVALEGADKDDIRTVSTIDTILAEAEFSSEDLAELLGLEGQLSVGGDDGSANEEDTGDGGGGQDASANDSEES